MTNEDSKGAAEIPSSTDALLAFRALWLRAIAEAWTNEAFKNELLHSGAAEQVLCKWFPHYKWEWNGVLTLKVVDGKEMKWIGDNWIWPVAAKNGEGLKVYVPLKPPKNATQDQYPAALADYYRKRPSLLVSDDQLSGWSLGSLDGSLAGGVAGANGSPGGAFTFAPTPKGGFVPQGTDFANFEVALVYAMSRAWESVEFREYLQTNEKLAIASCHGYRAPWMLPIKIADAAELEWKQKERTWTGFRANELTVGLPQAPVELNERGVAIAAYNATGAQFPFTCCA
jgi:ribosomally synthesized peptide (two-chain TOMM family)